MDARLKPRVRNVERNLLLAGAALLLLAACERGQESQQMAWTRAALERNPNLEIVATDAKAGVITVRDRRRGEVSAVKLDEVAGVPVALLQAAQDHEAGGTDGTAGLDAAAAKNDATSSASEQGEEAATTAEEPAADDTAAATATPAIAGPGSDYKIERSGGRVKVSGPGVSIVSGETAPAYTAKGEPGQRTVDPIICEGERMMQLDGRDIYVEGDAITVRGGCELYITNSRIVASSAGVVVRGGTVHIANSYVEGAKASFDAQDDAKMYLRGSTFHGLSRRSSAAAIEDQGGNRGLPAL
jgi:hypothetical protein